MPHKLPQMHRPNAAGQATLANALFMPFLIGSAVSSVSSILATVMIVALYACFLLVERGRYGVCRAAMPATRIGDEQQDALGYHLAGCWFLKLLKARKRSRRRKTIRRRRAAMRTRAMHARAGAS